MRNNEIEGRNTRTQQSEQRKSRIQLNQKPHPICQLISRHNSTKCLQIFMKLTVTEQVNKNIKLTLIEQVNKNVTAVQDTHVCICLDEIFNSEFHLPCKNI